MADRSRSATACRPATGSAWFFTPVPPSRRC